jgi:DNA-binding beta-propeller fold protein YncE
VAIEAQDLAYDPARGHLYAAIGNAADKHGNTILALNPADGTIVWSVNVGSDPAVLAMSRSSKTLWVGLRGTGAIQRVDLAKRTAGPLIMLNQGRFGTQFAETMQVVPGKSDTLVVSVYSKGISPRHGGCVVFDNDTARATMTRGHTGSNRIVATDDPRILFGYNNETTDFGLRRLHVYKGGIAEEQCFHGVVQKFNTDIVYAGGRIYATTGAVVDVKTGQLVGTLPAEGAVAVDTAAKRAYVLGSRLVRQGDMITAFDTETLTKRASCKAPVPGAFRKQTLVLVGGTALAYSTEKQIIIAPVAMLK